MTRNQLISIVGKDEVDFLDSCQPFCDCLPLTSDGLEQWTSIVMFKESRYFLEKEIRGIKAIYYVDPKLTEMSEDENGDSILPDLSLIDWIVERYELIYA